MGYREIKFRFWDAIENKWMVDGRSETNIYDFAFRPGMNWTFINKSQAIDRIIVCQFTGLKDKNGVEIYEGDIVNRVGWYIGTNTSRKIEKVGKVTYHEKSASFLFDIGHFLGLIADNIELEVLGNIYQNPELL